jgi:hypothetical protein
VIAEERKREEQQHGPVQPGGGQTISTGDP